MLTLTIVKEGEGEHHGESVEEVVVATEADEDLQEGVREGMR